MTSSPTLSIITPTYNRRDVVGRAIDSALAWARTGSVEIIIVDDGSTDGTLSYLRNAYGALVASGQLKLVESPTNLGAAGAKNHGARAAEGEWLLFLDSDDKLVEQGQQAVLNAIDQERRHPVLFFRCIDMDSGALVGAPLSRPETIDIHTYLRRWRWGECLPVVRRDAFLRFPYDAKLRGHEGLAYARLLKYVAPGIIYPAVVRAYDTSGSDRLSRRSALWRRGTLIAAGFGMKIREFPRELGASGLMATALRFCFYTAAGQLMRAVDSVYQTKRE